MTATKLAIVLARLVRRLPASWQRRLTHARLALLAQFTLFAVVGLAGLAADTATVYGLRRHLGLLGAGLVAYGIGASTTWWLNRRWTFHGRGGGRMHRQWALFLAANLPGFVLNRGTYALLVTMVAACAAQPVLATSAGAVAGMFVNFGLARAVVFRAGPPTATDA